MRVGLKAGGSRSIALAGVYLFMSVIYGLTALIAIMATVLDLHIGFDEPENYIWDKWSIFDGTLFFAIGIFISG